MKSVLVIDDDPIHVEVATALLKSIGAAQVRSASGAAAARTELAKNGSFDLLLLDLSMPEYDGIEFLEYLREVDFRGAIVITSAAHESIRNAAVQLASAKGLSVAAVIEKPLKLQTLVPALAHI